MLATDFVQWADIITTVVILVVWLTFIPLTGSNPKKWRDYLVWSVYLTLAALVSNWVLVEAVSRIF